MQDFVITTHTAVTGTYVDSVSACVQPGGATQTVAPSAKTEKPRRRSAAAHVAGLQWPADGWCSRDTRSMLWGPIEPRVEKKHSPCSRVIVACSVAPVAQSEKQEDVEDLY